MPRFLLILNSRFISVIILFLRARGDETQRDRSGSLKYENRLWFVKRWASRKNWEIFPLKKTVEGPSVQKLQINNKFLELRRGSRRSSVFSGSRAFGSRHIQMKSNSYSSGEQFNRKKDSVSLGFYFFTFWGRKLFQENEFKKKMDARNTFFLCHESISLKRGVKLFFTVGRISIMAAFLKGRKHFVNSSNILLNNSLCIWLLECRNIVHNNNNVSNITTWIHLIWNLQNKSTGNISSISLRKGDHVSFKPSGASYNDAAVRIWPVHTCALKCQRSEERKKVFVFVIIKSQFIFIF